MQKLRQNERLFVTMPANIVCNEIA